MSAINGYRAMFDLVPDESEEPIELRLHLSLNGEPITETWLYQYFPPAPGDRKLY
ncbi:MAG: glucan biosynthesis protein [Halomonas sp.]|uniref:glucan biosynthesis protein n=1 Tax=Halomonas sp. TaxID=1486246 RepID=UPI00286FDBCA|nr:glucan biosynthesis protein [Halomonas sp.]MDR9440100.1 glucan biosynthesis protein [Halomonas sp.]